MKSRAITLCILFLTVCVQSSPLTSFSITAKERHGGCLIAVENTNEMLDIRSNCIFSNQDDRESWKSLIISTQSYLIEKNGYQWRGYLYLKNPIHYKNVSLQLSLYQKLVQQLLTNHHIQTVLSFEDKYSLLLQQVINKSWTIISLSINYAYNLIEPFNVNEDIFKVESSSNQTSNLQQSVAIRKLSGKGLHQQVNMTLILDLETSLYLDPTCKVIIQEILPESTYIDYDQLRSVKKFQVINVELPEPAAKQYYYEYTVSLNRFTPVGSRKYNYLYPIHFRYPAPSHLNYTLVVLHPSKIQLACNNGSKIIDLPEDPFNNRGHASIFNGSSHDTKVVSMVTFILMVVAAMVIVKQLKKI